MPNGKRGDNPFSDMTVHGAHPFPADIEELLRRIDAWPLAAWRELALLAS
jgi:hypothetical protein